MQDLKLGNVLLKTHRIDRRGYVAKVSDFGELTSCLLDLACVLASIHLHSSGANICGSHCQVCLAAGGLWYHRHIIGPGVLLPAACTIAAGSLHMHLPLPLCLCSFSEQVHSGSCSGSSLGPAAHCGALHCAHLGAWPASLAITGKHWACALLMPCRCPPGRLRTALCLTHSLCCHELADS